jgi:hypothetical protein
MKAAWKKQLALGLVALLMGVLADAPIEVATAAEAGAPAPDFNLPATTGANIALSDFKGKKWVFLEFYGGDFVPT